MKKNSRLPALLLALLLFVLSACSPSGLYEETTEADSTAPKTTDTVNPETTEEPSISVVVVPDTTPEIPPEETTSPYPPHDGETIRVLVQNAGGEAFISDLADGELATYLSAREAALFADHNTIIRASVSADIVDRVKNGVLSSNNDFDFLILNTFAGAELLTYGALEALSEVGIDITPTTSGVHTSLTESLSIGGGTYLVACDALISEMSSLRVIEYGGAALSSDPLKMAAEGKFTVELLLNYISELKNDAFAVEQSSILALFSAVGGEVFVRNGKGIPQSSLSEDRDFSEKYENALGLLKQDSGTNRTAAFTVTEISPAREGVSILPLPKADADSEYVTLADASSMSLLAAPVGVVDGVRLAKLFNCLCVASGDLRAAERAKYIDSKSEFGEPIFAILEDSVRLDLGIILGWGDIDDYIADSLAGGKSAKNMLGDRVATMRNKAVETAAGILAERLNIK